MFADILVLKIARLVITMEYLEKDVKVNIANDPAVLDGSSVPRGRTQVFLLTLK